MKSKGHVFLLISAVICMVHLDSSYAVTCRSYGGQNGECVDLARCPPLLAVILSHEKTTEHIRMLQQLTCLSQSVSASEPVVCCPLGEIVSSSFIQKDILQQEGQSHTTTAKTTKRPNTYIQQHSPTLSPSPSVVVHPVRRPVTERPSNIHKQNEELPNDEVLQKKFRELIPPLANCSVSFLDDGGRIIGGEDAKHGLYPWMARLGYKNLRTHKVEYYCGGVVINKRYILTAGHCCMGYDDNFELVHVRLGEHNTKESVDCNEELKSCSVPEDFQVEKVITHPGYNTMTKHNDIALVRVNRDIGFQTYFIKPVCLPFLKEYGLQEPKPPESLSGIVAGWGRTNWTKSEGSHTLQHVELPIVSREKCMKDFRNRIDITPQQLCAGGESNQDSCGGDSGGPLLVYVRQERKGPFVIPKKKFQFGIVSFGPVKCGMKIPGVYTKVSEYLYSFILKNMEP